MAKTVHVLPADKGWAVKREGRKADGFFQTQREAIESAREIVRSANSGQLVVHGRDGRVRDHETYGMPRVQAPHGKKSAAIDRAVGKVTVDRLCADRHPPQG